MKNKLFLVAVVFLFGPGVFAGGTVVGNGGDPVFEFLEATRFSMTESLKFLANNPDQQTNFCEKASLSKDQIAFCKNYFLKVVPILLKLNQGPSKTLFVLREEPLKVIGPDGLPMIVAARTGLGPEGVIEFHRDSIKTLQPTQILFLMTHEFMHKASTDSSNLTDNDPIGPFSTGREMIDSASESLVNLARRNALIGTQFGLRDIFDCTAETGTSVMGARISSSRLFKAIDLMSYHTSFSKNPTDGSIFIPETGDSVLLLRFDITEPNNCGDDDIQRSTRVQIVRSARATDGAVSENIISERLLNSNPMCPQTHVKIEIESGPVRFSCSYFGSQGTTSSGISLGKK